MSNSIRKVSGHRTFCPPRISHSKHFLHNRELKTDIKFVVQIYLRRRKKYFNCLCTVIRNATSEVEGSEWTEESSFFFTLSIKMTQYFFFFNLGVNVLLRGIIDKLRAVIRKQNQSSLRLSILTYMHPGWIHLTRTYNRLLAITINKERKIESDNSVYPLDDD